ncbi:MAG: hypothetical protein KJZ79_12100 [Bryobacteraceae bacterium]|nr:hypothetical protein [Bryobacteraceae bacterium]
MKLIRQNLDEILARLRPLDVDWRDETALRVVEALKRFPKKARYQPEDLQALLDEHFDDALLLCRLFLGLSKDQFVANFKAVHPGGVGAKAFASNPAGMVDALVRLGVLQAIESEIARPLHWSDVLVERLRSGRGSAIAGQKRGRDVEDFVQVIIEKVFSGQFSARCTFQGPRGFAKCDFAIPDRLQPRIVIEAKGYAATGSKMTDILGDIEKIIAAKRADTAFLFFTDGLSWHQRKSDLRKIVEYQNRGDITRVYTQSDAARFEADLDQLRLEYGL